MKRFTLSVLLLTLIAISISISFGQDLKPVPEKSGDNEDPKDFRFFCCVLDPVWTDEELGASLYFAMLVDNEAGSVCVPAEPCYTWGDIGEECPDFCSDGCRQGVGFANPKSLSSGKGPYLLSKLPLKKEVPTPRKYPVDVDPLAYIPKFQKGFTRGPSPHTSHPDWYPRKGATLIDKYPVQITIPESSGPAKTINAYLFHMRLDGIKSGNQTNHMVRNLYYGVELDQSPPNAGAITADPELTSEYSVIVKHRLSNGKEANFLVVTHTNLKK